MMFNRPDYEGEQVENTIDYKLIFDGLFKWKREGLVADALSGGFINKREANRALELYLLAKNPISDISGDADLESLSAKADLVKWASENNIDVPAKHKQPSAIKKFLMGGKD